MILVTLLSLVLPAQAAVYDLDTDHSAVKFEVSHLAFSTVEGRFDTFKGQLTLSDDDKMVTSIKGEVEAASINTNNSKRDDHLRTDDFFNVKKFPKLMFEATNLKVTPGNEAAVKGKLTMHGITKEVPFKLTFKGTGSDPYGNFKAAVVAKATVNRKDFGLTWNQALETGGVVVGEEVQITVLAEANKATAPATKKQK